MLQNLELCPHSSKFLLLGWSVEPSYTAYHGVLLGNSRKLLNRLNVALVSCFPVFKGRGSYITLVTIVFWPRSYRTCPACSHLRIWNPLVSHIT
jgi:hypothetical protein